MLHNIASCRWRHVSDHLVNVECDKENPYIYRGVCPPTSAPVVGGNEVVPNTSQTENGLGSALYVAISMPLLIMLLLSAYVFFQKQRNLRKRARDLLDVQMVRE